MGKMNKLDTKTFIHLFNRLEEETTEIAEFHGWVIPIDNPERLSARISLMHEELSEANRALRTGDTKSEKIPEFTEMEEEFADVILRIMHFSKRMKLRVAQAMIAKMKFNENRPFKHGGKRF